MSKRTKNRKGKTTKQYNTQFLREQRRAQWNAEQLRKGA
jgi:hypothetical protein